MQSRRSNGIDPTYSGPSPWWSLRGEARALAKIKSDHSADDAIVVAMFPQMVREKRSRPSKPKPETIDVLRNRVLALADELERQFLKDRQRRENNDRQTKSRD